MNVSLILILVWSAVDGNSKCYRKAASEVVTSYEPYEETWQNFKRKYGRTYPSEDEEARRREAFIENLKRIEAHNKDYLNEKVSFYMGISPFTDMTQAEHIDSSGRRSQLSDTDANALKCTNYTSPSLHVPDNIDWVEKGYVTPVEDQTTRCNSCYAFSTIASMEGKVKNLTGSLVALSKQQIVDCSEGFYNEGCKGGSVVLSYNYINAIGGIQTEADYPYIAKNKTCKFDKTKAVATITACRRIKKESEDELKRAVFHEGPISVSIDSGHASFKGYRGGIYEDPNCKNDQDSIIHSVAVVGYGTENGKDYWLIKNSNGTDWGLDGYMCLIRNKNNMCGVATEAYFPVVGRKENLYTEL